MSNSKTTDGEKSKKSMLKSKRSQSDLEKWDECCRSGLSLMFGGVVLGSCASILTMTPFPFLVLSGIGLYSAVESCDNIFRDKTIETNPVTSELGKED